MSKKFYSSFYALNLNENILNTKLGKQLGALLLNEVANFVLCHLSGSDLGIEKVVSDQLTILTDKEKNGLQYLAGYVFYKLHSKLRNSKNWESTQSQ